MRAADVGSQLDAPSAAKGYSTNSMGLLVRCSIALVSTKDDISKHLFLSEG